MAIPFTPAEDGNGGSFDFGTNGTITVKSVMDGETERVILRLDGAGVNVVDVTDGGGHLEVRDLTKDPNAQIFPSA